MHIQVVKRSPGDVPNFVPVTVVAYDASWRDAVESPLGKCSYVVLMVEDPKKNLLPRKPYNSINDDCCKIDNGRTEMSECQVTVSRGDSLLSRLFHTFVSLLKM